MSGDCLGTRFPPDRSPFTVSSTKYQHVVSPAPLLPPNLYPGMGQYPFTSSSVLPLTVFTASIPTVTTAGLYDTHFAFSSSTPGSFHLGPIKSINTICTTTTDTNTGHNGSNFHRHLAQVAQRTTSVTSASGAGVEPRGVILISGHTGPINPQTSSITATAISEGLTSSLFQIWLIETGTGSSTSLSTPSHLNLPSVSGVSFTVPLSSSFSSSVTEPLSALDLGGPSTSTSGSGPTLSETDSPPHTSTPTTGRTPTSSSGPIPFETDPSTSKTLTSSSGPSSSETDPPPHTSIPTTSTTADGTTASPTSTLAPSTPKPSSTSSTPTMSNPPDPDSSLEASSTTSFSDFSSTSIPPSASISASRNSTQKTVMTSTSFLPSSSSTFTSNTSPSSSSTTSISSSSHTSVSPLPSSSTSSLSPTSSTTSSPTPTSSTVIPPSSSPSQFPASAFPPTWRTAGGVWSTITTTKVYTTSIRGGGSTVITTVIYSGVLSTNNPLVGSRFSRDTRAVIGVAVSATVGVILSVLIVFFWCKPFRDRKERENRRRSRRSALRFSGPARAASGSGSGPSGGSLSRDSSALILGVGYAGETSRSRSGEEPDDRDEEEGEEEEEEEVWRSALVEEDDDIGAGMGGAGGVATLPTPSESGGGVGGRQSSLSHSVQSHTYSHSQTHSRSQSHSSRNGHGRSLDNTSYAGRSVVVLATGAGAGGVPQPPPSMAEFGTGPPVSYAAYTYPLGSVGNSGYAGGGIGEGAQGTQSIQNVLGTQRGSFGSLGGFVPPPSSYMPHASHTPFYVPYGQQGIVGAVLPMSGEMGHVGGETGEIGREGVVVAESTSEPVTIGQGQRGEGEDMSSAGRVSDRGPKRRLTASTSGGHNASADAPGSAPTPPEPARTRSGSAPASMGSLPNTRGGKNLRGIMNRIRTSVPSIQVADVVLPSRRSSRDMPSGTLYSSVTTETRPGYDYGVVGRPSQRFVREVQIQPPTAVALGYPYPAVPPGTAGVAHSRHQAQTQGYAPYVYGHAAGAVSFTAEHESEAEEGGEEDSICVRGGLVTHGLLDPDLSLGHAFASDQGGNADGGGRSSPNVEGASLRDYVDYSRKIGGMVKNSMARSTTTFDTFDQDGRSIGGGVPSMPGTPG